MGSPVISSKPAEPEGLGTTKDKIIEAIAEEGGGPVTAPSVAEKEYVSVKRRAVLKQLHALEEDGHLVKHDVGNYAAFSLASREPTLAELEEYIRGLDDGEIDAIAGFACEELGQTRIDVQDPDPDAINALLPEVSTDGLQRVKAQVYALVGGEEGPPSVREYLWAAPLWSIAFAISTAAAVAFLVAAVLGLLLGALTVFGSGSIDWVFFIAGLVLIAFGIVFGIGSSVSFKRARIKTQDPDR